MEEVSSPSSDTSTVRGQTNELDGFSVKIQVNTRQHQPIVRTLTDVFQLDKIHEQVLTKLSSKQAHYLLVDQPFKDFEHNTFFVQVTLAQPLAGQTFSFDVIYQSDSSNRQREQDLAGNYFNDELARLQKQFDERFETIFQLKNKQNMDAKKISFARATLSNLIGGISYFTGRVKGIEGEMHVLPFFRTILGR